MFALHKLSKSPMEGREGIKTPPQSWKALKKCTLPRGMSRRTIRQMRRRCSAPMLGASRRCVFCEMVVEQWRPKATEVDCHCICGTQSHTQWRIGVALEVHQNRRDPTHIGKARFDTMDLLVSAHGKANWSLPLTHRAIPYSYLFLGLPLLDSTCLHDTTTPSDLA